MAVPKVLRLNLPRVFKPALNPDATPPRDERILSPSQQETFTCQRKGAFKYLLGFPDPGSIDTEIGRRFHKVLEDWLKDGIKPDEKTQEGVMAMATIPYLPAPRAPGVLVEGTFTFEMFGVQYTGTADLEYRRPAVGGVPGRLVVHDHKSCGSFDYMKTEEDLRTDTQATIYAWHAFQKYPDIKELDLEWGYTTKEKKGPRYRQSVATVTRAETEAQAKKLAEYGQTILAIKRDMPRTVAGVNALPFDTEQCPKFRGGCPFKGTPCSINTVFASVAKKAHRPFKAIGDLKPMNETLKAKFEALKARTAQAAPSSPPPVDAPAPTPAAAPSGTFNTQAIRAKLGVAQGINPPPLTPATSAPTLETTLAASVASVAPPAPTAEQVASANASVAHAVAGEAPKAVEAPRRGRKPGSKNKPKGLTAGGPDYDPQGPELDGEEDYEFGEKLAKQTIQSLTDASSRNGTDLSGYKGQTFSVFINCFPTAGDSGGEIVDLAVLLKPIHDCFREEQGIPHFGMVDYGKGPAMLAYALEQYLIQHPLNPYDAVVVDTRTAEGTACVAVLTRMGTVVARGF